MHILHPADWLPLTAADLIGPAALVARALLAKARRPDTAGWRILVTGEPGCGKSSVSKIVAAAIAGHPVEVEIVSGKAVNLDAVRDWMNAVHTRSLWGGRSVKVIEELDKCSTEGAVLLLAYLDAVKECPHRAVLASSNKGVSEMDSRLQSRFQHFPVEPPSPADIERLLQQRCRIAATHARKLAEGCQGDVRAAMNDAQSWLDMCRASGPDLAAAA